MLQDIFQDFLKIFVNHRFFDFERVWDHFWWFPLGGKLSRVIWKVFRNFDLKKSHFYAFFIYKTMKQNLGRFFFGGWQHLLKAIWGFQKIGGSLNSSYSYNKGSEHKISGTTGSTHKVKISNWSWSSIFFEKIKIFVKKMVFDHFLWLGSQKGVFLKVFGQCKISMKNEDGMQKS